MRRTFENAALFQHRRPCTMRQLLFDPEQRVSCQPSCQRLKIVAQNCIYVGDGSNQELTGAATTGMRPILKRTDLRDVYDRHRPEVETWRGLAVDKISELCDLYI